MTHRVYITRAEQADVRLLTAFAPYPDPRHFPAIGTFHGYEVHVNTLLPYRAALDDEDTWLSDGGDLTFEEWTRAPLTSARLLARAKGAPHG
jgi:hypothetical protein